MRRGLGLGIAVLVVLVAVFAWRSCRRSSDAPGAGDSSGSATTGSGAEHAARRDLAPPKPATLSGRVTRASDGAAVPGAVVSITPAELMAMIVKSDAPTLVAVTDASGAWKIDHVNPGALAVAATASGYLPGKRTKLVVAAGEQKSGVDLTLDAGGTVVSGIVTDVGGGPVADARITASETGRPDLFGRADFVTLAKPDGKYAITLPRGDFQLTASHDDYVATSHMAEVADKPLTVDFEMIPGGVIRGQVIARDENVPVAGALVRASGGRRGGGGGESLVRTDADGKFTLRGLGSGELALTAMGRGYASTNPTDVSIGIGEQVDGVRVYVDRAFSISGRVVKQGHKDDGVAGVTLGCFSIATQQFGLSIEPSAKDGAFEIVGVRPASYMLFAVGEGSVPEIGKNVDVVDKDVTGVVVEMATGVTVAGRVEPPVAGVEIGLELAGQIGLGNMFDAAKTLLVHGTSDARGMFELHNVPAGSFQITADAPDGQAGKLAVTMADADQSGLVVKLEARGTVSGRVLDTNGAPAAGERVTATALGGEKKPTFRMNSRDFGDGATTLADGSFRIQGLESGKYRIRAGSAREDDIAMLLAKQDDKDKLQKNQVEVEVVVGKDKSGITLTVEARDGEIHGIVIAPDGKPAGDAWVTATRATPTDQRLAQLSRRWGGGRPVLTNADGGFVIAKLRKGTYDLTVDGPRGGSRAEKPGVKTGETVTIQLAPLGTLAGKVTIGGAPATDYDLDCDGPTDKHRSIQARDGAYSLEHLAPGTYECTASNTGGQITDKIEIPAGSTTHDFTMARWATITGTVVDVLTKRPVPGIIAIAGSSRGEGKAFGEVLAGRAPVSDPQGKFVIARIAAGAGDVSLMGKDGFAPLAKRPYTIAEGQTVDLGVIAVVAPRTGDAGTFGLATDVRGTDVVVTSVAPGGPAEAAGVKEGDKLASINGRPIAELTPPIAKLILESGVVGVGVTVTLALDRGGSPVDASVTSVKW